MRPYNSVTDYHLIELAAKADKSLICVKQVLNFNGIIWPSNFNGDRTPETIKLDKDICRAWSAHKSIAERKGALTNEFKTDTKNDIESVAQAIPR